MVDYEFIKEIIPKKKDVREHKQALYKVGDNYVLASRLGSYEGEEGETMLFDADAAGTVDNWFELWGIRDGKMDLEEAVKQFASSGENVEESFKQVRKLKNKMWSY